jgi:hypothetical protein
LVNPVVDAAGPAARAAVAGTPLLAAAAATGAYSAAWNTRPLRTAAAGPRAYAGERRHASRTPTR